jgi:hypothetical protein
MYFSAKSIGVLAITALLGVASLGVAFFSLPVPTYAQCVAPRDMNGVWKANDGGTYYVRQIGNDVWWLGMSGDGGRSWTNVYKGVRNGDTVTGTWADVPHGGVRSSGILNLHVDGTTGVLGFSRRQVSGGFGGSRWYQPCNDTVQNPANR